MKIIDSHVHLPVNPAEPREAAKQLVWKMDQAGVSVAVVIAVKLSQELFRRTMSVKKLNKAVSKSGFHLALCRNKNIHKIMMEPEAALREHEMLLEEHSRGTGDVIAASTAFPDRLVPVASYDPDLDAEENVEELSKVKDRILGVKLFPTMHFLDPASKRLDVLYDFLEAEGLVLVVHTGCDPGIWELPPMCDTARPSRLERVARKHRDLDIIVAHMGSYSLLQPGIFFHEAVELGRMFENVYFDTSAVDRYFIEKGVRKIGVEKILYGSDYPYMVGLTMRDLIEEVRGADLTPRELEALFYENPRRILANHGWRHIVSRL